MWKIQFHFNKSIFKNLNSMFWNPEKSWQNKWKVDENGKLKERFIFSSAVLVWTTDAFNLFQFIFHTSWQLIVSILLSICFSCLYYFIIIFALIKITFSFSFELLFTKLFNKTN